MTRAYIVGAGLVIDLDDPITSIEQCKSGMYVPVRSEMRDGDVWLRGMYPIQRATDMTRLLLWASEQPAELDIICLRQRPGYQFIRGRIFGWVVGERAIEFRYVFDDSKVAETWLAEIQDA